MFISNKPKIFESFENISFLIEKETTNSKEFTRLAEEYLKKFVTNAVD